MQTLKNVVTGLCSIALVLAPVAAPLALAVAEEPWEIVPEDTLRDLRGGMDLGDLVASFAIERVVEIRTHLKRARNWTIVVLGSVLILGGSAIELARTIGAGHVQ